MTEAISLDGLTEYCGYFVGGVEVNGGYGCNHPEQTERENGQGIMAWEESE